MAFRCGKIQFMEEIEEFRLEDVDEFQGHDIVEFKKDERCG